MDGAFMADAPVEAWAEGMAGEIVRAGPPGEVWRGTLAGTVWGVDFLAARVVGRLGVCREDGVGGVGEAGGGGEEGGVGGENGGDVWFQRYGIPLLRPRLSVTMRKLATEYCRC